MRDPIIREFLLAFWKIHVLHHAKEGGVYGQWMLQELRRHGYDLSPGTLYPLLFRMEAHGWLRSASSGGSKARRTYRLTPAGRRVLVRLQGAIEELHGEVSPGPRSRVRSRRPKNRQE